jgi:hypothetical protein
MTGQQTALLVVPGDLPGVMCAHRDLIKDALDDAAAWREQLEDADTVEAYQELAAEIERAEDDAPGSEAAA